MFDLPLVGWKSRRSMAQLKVVLVDELVTYLDQGRLDIASKVLDGVHLPSLLKLLSVPWIHPRSTTENSAHEAVHSARRAQARNVSGRAPRCAGACCVISGLLEGGWGRTSRGCVRAGR